MFMKKIKNLLILLTLISIMIIPIPSFAEFKIENILIENPIIDNSEEIKILEEKLEEEKDKPKNVIIKKVYNTNESDISDLEEENEELRNKIKELNIILDNFSTLLNKGNTNIKKDGDSMNEKKEKYVNPLLPFEDQLTEEAKKSLYYKNIYKRTSIYIGGNKLDDYNSRISKSALKLMNNQIKEEKIFVNDLNINLDELMNFPTDGIAYNDFINILVNFTENGILEYVTVVKKES